MLVPPGMVIKTGYVDVFKVRFANRARMSVGDFDRTYQKRLQTQGGQCWPCPSGRWIADEFELFDGRHELLASIALGFDSILVAWIALQVDE